MTQSAATEERLILTLPDGSTREVPKGTSAKKSPIVDGLLGSAKSRTVSSTGSERTVFPATCTSTLPRYAPAAACFGI